MNWFMKNLYEKVVNEKVVLPKNDMTKIMVFAIF